MNVSLTRELGDVVSAKVASGRYLSASEVVREGLRLLEARDQDRDVALAQVRFEVEEGWRQLERDDTVPAGETFRDLRARLANR